MGSRSSAAYNPTLTNYAQGLAQDTASALANFLAPVVIVPAGIGQYKAYDAKNAFQIYDTKRGIGGDATRIKFSASDPTFNCKPNALEIPIDIAERQAAGDVDGAQERLERAKVATLVSDATISHENEVLTVVAAAVSAESGKGVWSSADVDPIDEIDEQIEAIAKNIGMMPNRIAIGLSTMRVLKNHPKVKARFPGADALNISAERVARELINPAVEVRVGVLSKDTTKFGKTSSKSFIMGAEVYIFYASDNPSQYDATACKTFRTQGGGVDAVYMYQDGPRLDIAAVDWSDDIKAASAASIKRITVS